MGAGSLVSETGVHAQVVVGASVAGVRAWGVTGAPEVRGRVTTSFFGGVTAGLVERKSLTLGMGPINLSVSVAQSNRRGSCGVALCAA
jgi:hypothetical protein